MKRFTVIHDPHLPLLAIDLGYSTAQKSCGVALSTSRQAHLLAFGECIRYTDTLIRSHGPHTLILEAVLSTYHLPNGNPAIRGSFEKGRGWYHGPGVTTFAAALQFLNELDRLLPARIKKIPIIEGFLSYKPTRTTHTADALQMIEAFESAERFNPIAGSLPIGRHIDAAPEIRRYNAPPKG